jgi:hypothetical protein
VGIERQKKKIKTGVQAVAGMVSVEADSGDHDDDNQKDGPSMMMTQMMITQYTSFHIEFSCVCCTLIMSAHCRCGYFVPASRQFRTASLTNKRALVSSLPIFYLVWHAMTIVDSS